MIWSIKLPRIVSKKTKRQTGRGLQGIDGKHSKSLITIVKEGRDVYGYGVWYKINSDIFSAPLSPSKKDY